jgi:hypothetical protein
VLGEAAKAEQLQAALENLCLILCEEYDDLKRAIAAYTQVSEFSMSALRHKRTFRLGMWRDQNTKSQRSAAISLLAGRLMCFEATTICNSPFLNR